MSLEMKLPRLLPLALLLGGCNDGSLTLSVADAPVDGATQVVLEFTGVDVVDASGKTHSFTFNPPLQQNILSTTGQAAVLLNQGRLPVGDYQSITLKVSAGTAAQDSFIVLTNTICPQNATHQCPLELPSTDTSLQNISIAFHVTRQQNIALTADFDLRKSVLNPDVSSDPYVLKPTVRVVSNDAVGTLTGTVAAALVSGSGCSPAVYIYSGSGVTPGEVGGSGAEPVASALLVKSGSGPFPYTAAFLNAGTYTAALTCDAALDDPAKNDGNVTFIQSQNFTVTAGNTTTGNFQ